MGRGTVGRTVSHLLLTAFACLTFSDLALPNETAYRLPDQTIVDIIDSRRTPWVQLGPRREWMLLLERPGYPTIAEMAERELRLAGLRFKPDLSAPSREWSSSGLRLVRVSDGEELPVRGLPDEPRINYARWSPDGARVSFTNMTPEGVELWVLDVGDREARRILGPEVSLVAEEGPAWVWGRDALVCCLIPADRGPEPAPPAAPEGPVVQENIGKTAPARTYQDLLASPYDEYLFEHYLTSQLAIVGLDGSVTPLGEPALIWAFDPAPAGGYLLVHTLHRPFSYLVPAERFPDRIEVWNLDGEALRVIADLPLREEIPIARGSVAAGPRAVQWRADAPAELCWAEALDGGDAGAEADLRDRLFLLSAPFVDDPLPWLSLKLRLGQIMWGHEDLAVVTEWWWDTRKTRAWRVWPREPGAEPVLLIDRSWEDAYSDPGLPVMVRNGYGREVMLTADDANTVFLVGDGASPEGDRPFLDTFDTLDKEVSRLFRSEAPYYERPVIPLSKEARYLITRRESVEDVPNYYVRDLLEDTLRQITFFPHPTPQLAGLRKELIHYERADGVDLNATLYLPPGYDPEVDGPLPMLMWAYPREYRSADAAGQVRDSPYRFDWIGWWSPVLWLTQGYAALDGPTMPIIGEGDEQPNDTYVPQLVASAEAAVNEVVRRGVAEHGRIAIGGHSYGAFMAANLLAHSDLFAAGIAQTGAYNRTLTPFGFQSEDRTLWEAPDVYFAMSPFMHADKINEPILIVHGDADSNPGTFPMQSERFYNALKGLGKDARLVMLPLESHSYRARESILHLLWETQEWLERYVRAPAAQ